MLVRQPLCVEVSEFVKDPAGYEEVRWTWRVLGQGESYRVPSPAEAPPGAIICPRREGIPRQ